MASSEPNANPELANFTTSAPAPAPAPTEPTAITRTSAAANTRNDTSPSRESTWRASTLAIHADDHLRRVPDIAPPIHLSSTFHYSNNPEKLITVKESKEARLRQPPSSDSPEEDHIYSRETTHNTTRLETILRPLLGGDAVVYSSGLAALHALYILLKPRRVAISGGYHGAHAVLALHKRLTGVESMSLEDGLERLQAGDVFHVETPVNPTGEARDLARYAAAAKKVGAWVVVDATFGPPGLQQPFALGADIVMHSATKYLGGHSDLLCGVLATRNAEWARQLRDDRTVTGSVVGGLEAWLVIRSLRTLELRVERASANAGKLVRWLEDERRKDGGDGIGTVVDKVLHASLQAEALGADDKGRGDNWLVKQMPNGYGPVFAIIMKSKDLARRLPSQLRVFQHATSLGGVESLIEWRAMSDDTVDEALLRVSVGIENWEDLREDLRVGLLAVAGLDQGKGKVDEVK